MNGLLEKADAGGTTGKPPVETVAPSVPQKQTAIPAAGNVATKPLPSVPIGKPGYAFKHDPNTPQGQDERREHGRIRKADKRAAYEASKPAALSPVSLLDPLQATTGEQMPGVGVTSVALGVETFVPWVAADVSDFTDELVELSETKRVTDFVSIAREAGMPAKFIATIEKDACYPTHSKKAFKQCLADCAAKWLNKTGVSSKNKEEVKLLFVMVTIKMQGVRLKRDLIEMCEAEKAKRVTEPKPKTAEPQIDREAFLAINTK